MRLPHAVSALVLAGLAGAAQAATHVVTIEGMAMQPATLTVKAGDTITWENKDVVPHTVTSPGHFDSKQLHGGKRWTWTARSKGRFPYICTYHPGMQATVVVE
ncbi:MAG: cupredoxin family copper-binding protein [Ramlibacter sp.]